MQRAAWARFYLGPGSTAARSVPVWLRIRDMNLCVRPAMDFRCSWWCFTKGHSDWVDRLQRSMIARLMRMSPRPEEAWECFVRRRSAAAATQARRTGLWSDRFAVRVQSWYKHARRNHICSWPGYLLNAGLLEWLRHRRVALGSKSCEGGRAQTRLRRGGVRTRFADGVSEAEDRTATF